MMYIFGGEKPVYTIDRFNAIRTALRMPPLISKDNTSLADDIEALEMVTGIRTVQPNYLYKTLNDYVGRRIHRLEVHCGLAPFDEAAPAPQRAFCYNCARLSDDAVRSNCDQCRAITQRARAEADIDGAHLFWLGADGAPACGCRKCDGEYPSLSN